jgi:DNA-binding transcriptional LysR family regulator
MAKQAVAGLPLVGPPPAWLPRHEESPFAAAAAGSSGDTQERLAVPRGRSSRAINRSRRALAGGLAMTGLAAAALGLGAWLVPPPPATVTFQQEVRQHLVLINDPLSDQTSYLLEARHP